MFQSMFYDQQAFSNDWERPLSQLESSAVLRIYFEMYQLLQEGNNIDHAERCARRRKYLLLMTQFERAISTIRLLKKSEMARSQHWDFKNYLRESVVLGKCRLTLRLAYLVHAFRMPAASGLAQTAGRGMFGALFFGSCSSALA